MVLVTDTQVAVRRLIGEVLESGREVVEYVRTLAPDETRPLTPQVSGARSATRVRHIRLPTYLT
jgi:hypothetical protein